MPSPSEHMRADHEPEHAAQADSPADAASVPTLGAGLLDLFEREGLMRYSAEGDAEGEVEVRACAPVVVLGPGDADSVAPPDPALCHYPGKPAAEMTLDDYNAFLFLWLERAAEHSLVRCARCGKRLLGGDDLADADTWDAIMVEKELVAWMAVHFDCKKKIAKKLKGMNPFELAIAPPPALELADVVIPDVPDVEEVDDLGDLDSAYDALEDTRDEEESTHATE